MICINSEETNITSLSGHGNKAGAFPWRGPPVIPEHAYSSMMQGPPEAAQTSGFTSARYANLNVHLQMCDGWVAHQPPGGGGPTGTYSDGLEPPRQGLPQLSR